MIFWKCLVLQLYIQKVKNLDVDLSILLHYVQKLGVIKGVNYELLVMAERIEKDTNDLLFKFEGSKLKVLCTFRRIAQNELNEQY